MLVYRLRCITDIDCCCFDYFLRIPRLCVSIIAVLYSLRSQAEPCCILLSQLYTGSLYSILCTGFLFTLVCVMQSYMRLFIIGFSTSLYGSVVCMLALRASGPGFASRSADVIFRVNVQILTSLLRTFLKMTSDVKTTSDGKKKRQVRKKCTYQNPKIRLS